MKDLKKFFKRLSDFEDKQKRSNKINRRSS